MAGSVRRCAVCLSLPLPVDVAEAHSTKDVQRFYVWSAEGGGADGGQQQWRGDSGGWRQQGGSGGWAAEEKGAGRVSLSALSAAACSVTAVATRMWIISQSIGAVLSRTEMS